jgi:beta-1,4-mannosyl-glycoprotein beta-1,4-N-acetylglucosaminyltransferase
MLVDAFMFYNEFDVLELRLETLDEHVDRYVLVEAEVNHVGGPKPLYFQENKERYGKWLHKITHIIVKADEAPREENPWCREKFQRECILRGLEDVPNESIVMISDVDEIPDMTKVPYEKLPNYVCSLHMWMFQYSFDYIFTAEPWVGTVITTCELVKTKGPNSLRDARWKFPVFSYAGWHLSSFGDAKHVFNKLHTFAHAKDANEHRHLQTEENIKKWIEDGLFPDGATVLSARPSNTPLPAPVEVLRKLGMGKFP